MGKRIFKCENGAHHTGMCCPTCWNGHPKAVPDAMFKGSGRWEELVKRYWVNDAKEVGFSYEQAKFMYERFVK